MMNRVTVRRGAHLQVGCIPYLGLRAHLRICLKLNVETLFSHGSSGVTRKNDVLADCDGLAIPLAAVFWLVFASTMAQVLAFD